MSRIRRNSRLPLFVSIFVMVFLYAPIIVLVLYSFNDSRYPGAWNGFTLRWYRQLIEAHSVEVRDIWRATRNTLTVAFSATLISMVLGTMAAWALYRFRSRLQKFHQALIYAPLVVPDILMGISLLMLFVNLTMKLGLTTIIIAHTTFCISYVALVSSAGCRTSTTLWSMRRATSARTTGTWGCGCSSRCSAPASSRAGCWPSRFRWMTSSSLVWEKSS